MAFGLFKKKTYADTVYRNGFLHTLDAETEDATAVACKDGKVMRVGLEEEIEPLIGPDTEVVDLKGRFLVPGFIDLYGSPAAQVLEGSYLQLHSGLSAEEVAAAIEAWAAEHAPCEFVLAYGWFSDEEELPVLDEVCPDVPVLIIGEDSVGMRMNRTAQQMVKERAEAETFAVAVTPNFVFNTIMMKKPVSGEPVNISAWFKGNPLVHLVGVLGGCIWATGTLLSFVTAGTAGAAIAYALGQGATLVSALWGILVWREFKGAPKSAGILNFSMIVLFLAGIALLIVAGQ